MVEATTLNPSPIEIPLGQFVKMNNTHLELHRGFKMAINHRPSIMVITETRVGDDRMGRIIEGLPFDRFITTDTIAFAGDLWILWKKEDSEVNLWASTE